MFVILDICFEIPFLECFSSWNLNGFKEIGLKQPNNAQCYKTLYCKTFKAHKDIVLKLLKFYTITKSKISVKTRLKLRIWTLINFEFCCIRHFVPLRLERKNRVFLMNLFKLHEMTCDTFKSMFFFLESSEKGCRGGIVWEISILLLFVIFNILCQAYRIRVILILFSIYK